MVHPKSNRELFGRVESGGSAASEYYLGEAQLAWRFQARSRIIVGLSDMVVVVEAAEKSGVLITARHALDAGRDVWAMPGSLDFTECQGSNALLSDCAGVLWDVERFVEAVGPEPSPLRLTIAQDPTAEARTGPGWVAGEGGRGARRRGIRAHRGRCGCQKGRQ